MPKKTKRQKIAAQQHKQHIVEMSQAQYSSHFPAETVSTETQIKTIEKPTQPSKKQELFSSSTEVFKHELVKSLFICVGLIVLEAGIYLAQMNGFSINSILSF